METGKPGLASAPVHINSTAAQTEKRMDIQAPLMAVYIPTVPALPAQPYTQPPAPTREPATLHLAVPPLYSMETLPFLTLHIAGGLQSQAGLSLAAVSPSARMKSAGKHVCPHCGRDCMKPSVLEKHLRCHTGERPYPCTTCGISFKTQSNLYKHKRTQAHARLSSESDQSCLGSLDSMSCSRETFPSSLSLEESGSMESDTTIPALETTSPTRTGRVFSVKKHVSVSQQSERNPADHETKEPNESAKVTREVEKKRMENKKMLLNASRHLPLQRQEATLFSKQWESSVSRGKSQSHESTDSGFSESSDHHPSPGSILLDHSMDSLTESIKEHLETASELGQAGQEPKQTAREQEQKTLEERISKLISENTAVVEDKQLENVRPRKTVLSKQGSIDLPMPYTYKDSFHFDMRISQNQNVGLQRNRMAGFYSSVPTQHSTTMEPAPLIRSNSLPFSVSLLQPERSTPTSSHQSDYLTLIRRRSSGQINPTGCTSKSVNQQSSTHRPLVRQIAVDCNHATDNLYSSSVEESCTASLSCDRDNGDNFGEPSNRKFRRKKAPKFAYDKWYMYGGGTFKKLYSAEKGGDDSVVKGRKCLTNPDHEVVQGLQKRLSEVHKETVATTGSAVNFTSSSSRVCHPEYPPAKLSHVSAVDFNPKTGHLPPSFGSLTPLRRNLSLSVLPLPLIGSLVNHKTGSLCRAEDGRLIKEKHTVSSSQLCESHIPSDRKKQKTDDKIIFPLETDPNTLTHPPPSVTGSPPQQTSNPTYINLQDNLKHTQLKGVLFPPSIINANTTSISTSPATSTPSAAKTSFLPKYQLKLPNATEPVSNPSPQAVDKSTVTDCCNISSAPPVSLMQSCDIKKTNLFSSTQSQLLLPCTATTLCQAETSSLNNNAKSNLAVVHQQFATATITTTCLHDYQAGLCSSSIQPTKSTGGSVAVQITRPSAPVVANFPATPTITTANNQTSAATITAFSQGQPNHPLSHTQLLPASDQSSPVNRPYVSSNTPIVPCQIVPFDQMQPAAQNVFHVHTADLQICLQIISDEQLALIEPQIERQAGSTLSQRRDMEAAAPEGIQKHAQSLEINNEGKDRSESLVTLNMERIKTQLSEQFGEAEANLQLTEHSNFTQTRVSADSKPPETQILSQRPHNYGNVNTVKETQTVTTSVVPTVASLNSEKSGRSQTSEERPVLSLNCCTEEQLLPDSRVSQGGLASQTVSGQPKLNMTCLSSSTVNQNNMRGEILENENQNKSQNQESKIAKGETSEYNTSKLESGETHSSPQDRLGRTSGASCADELSGSVHSYSINKSKAPGQLNPQASIHCSNPVESTSSGTLNSSQHADMRCDFVSPMNNSTAPLQEITVSESEDIINSAPSEKQQFTSVSSNIQVERPQDIPAVLTDIQSPTAGLLEGCASQRDPQTLGHGGTPGLPDTRDWRPAQTKQQCMESEGEGGMAGVDKNRGLKTDEEAGQRGEAESSCRYTCLQDVTKPEGEEIQAKTDSLKTPWLSEQHLSTTHSGMSEYPQQSPQQTPNRSNNLHSPATSSQTGLFNPPQPSLEISNSYFSQHWESSITHNQQPQQLCDTHSSQHINTQAQSTGTQHDYSPLQTFSNQDQKQSSIPLCVQRRSTTTTVSCATAKLAPGSHIITSPDVKPSSSTNPGQVSCPVHVRWDTAGLTWDPQAPNSNMLDNNNTLLPSKLFSYPETADYQDTKDKAPNEYASHSSNFGRSDITNKYQSFFFSGQLHGFPAAECLSGGLRPVQSCQDYTEDTSSSDDEGKLIIEL